MIPLRGLVLFPNMVLHFDVGRERSVLALNTAMQEGRRVFLITQKDIRGDNPGPEDLYKVGVIAEIRQIVRIQADTLRVLVEGKTRAVITGIVRELPYFTVEVAPLPMRTRIRSAGPHREKLLLGVCFPRSPDAPGYYRQRGDVGGSGLSRGVHRGQYPACL